MKNNIKAIIAGLALTFGANVANAADAPAPVVSPESTVKVLTATPPSAIVQAPTAVQAPVAPVAPVLPVVTSASKVGKVGAKHWFETPAFIKAHGGWAKRIGASYKFLMDARALNTKNHEAAKANKDKLRNAGLAAEIKKGRIALHKAEIRWLSDHVQWKDAEKKAKHNHIQALEKQIKRERDAFQNFVKNDLQVNTKRWKESIKNHEKALKNIK